MGDGLLPDSVRRAIESRPPTYADSSDGRRAKRIAALVKGTAESKTKRRRFEAPWPADALSGEWYKAYPYCLRASRDGTFNCKNRPATRGNFYCNLHGGLNKHTVRKSKERYIYWCLTGEPLLNPDIFDEFVVIWVKRLGDRIMQVPVSQQLRFLEIAVELLKEDDADTSETE